MTTAWRTATGFHKREPEPGIAFVGDSLAAFANCAENLRALKRQNPRLGIVLLPPSDSTNLQAAFPDFRIEVMPTLPKAGEVFLSRLRVRAIARLSKTLELPQTLLKAAKSRAVPIIDYSNTTTEEQLLELVGRERSWQDRSDRPVARFVANRLANDVERDAKHLNGRVTRINSVTDLKAKLRDSDIILCLGNGPSSNDAKTLSYKGAIVFRANHGWMSQSHFNKPDVVFTGTQSSMKKLTGTIIAVYGASTERVLLMTKGLRVFLKPLQYFVADKLVPINDFPWTPHRPTSGAVMIATAVALQPKKLVIAGLDMFSHADGAYASGEKAVNAYTAAHSGEKEANYLKQVLKSYAGELIVLSPALIELLAQND